MEKRSCIECGTQFLGRADKKFCTDACRSSYNNNLKGRDNNLMRNVNNILRKNRRILETLLIESQSEKAKVSGKKLSSLGFNFDWYTNIYTTKNGNNYTFLYDYGYLKLENNFFMIVKRNLD